MILEKRQLEKQSAKQNIFPKRIAIETKKYLTRKPEQENLIFQIKKKTFESYIQYNGPEFS